MKEIEDIKEKKLEELYKDLDDAQKKLREVRFKVANREVKDTNEKSKMRKRIARILTVIRQKEEEKIISKSSS